jgi:hypothetical protein
MNDQVNIRLDNKQIRPVRGAYLVGLASEEYGTITNAESALLLLPLLVDL